MAGENEIMCDGVISEVLHWYHGEFPIDILMRDGRPIDLTLDARCVSERVNDACAAILAIANDALHSGVQIQQIVSAAQPKDGANPCELLLFRALLAEHAAEGCTAATKLARKIGFTPREGPAMTETLSEGPANDNLTNS